jgi:hypothetical protein
MASEYTVPELMARLEKCKEANQQLADIAAINLAKLASATADMAPATLCDLFTNTYVFHVDDNPVFLVSDRGVAANIEG